MNTPPFFYKVKFHFLGQDEDKNIQHHNWEKDFHSSNPLEAREEAFEAFEEFLNNLKINGKIEKDKYGNYKIISPSGLLLEPEINEKETSLREIVKILSHNLQYRESLEILLVLTEDELVESLGYGDSVISLHEVSSQEVNKQELIDNLDMVELELYKRLGIEIEHLARTVKHYGEDYEEAGEEEEGAIRTILPTPFHWTSKEQYFQEQDEMAEDNDVVFNFKDVISQGETNTLELKPSLVYNFSKYTSNYVPLFNNIKTICGFLNSNGGVLIIGVSDQGTITGIEKDLELLKTKDKIRLKIDDTISSCFGNAVSSLIDVSFEKVEQKEVLVVSVKPSPIPVFQKHYNPIAKKTSKHFFIRRTASTTEINDVEEIINYVFLHPYNR